jgi:hypothetical protein
MGEKVFEQANLPIDWLGARPEITRKVFEIARAVNPLIDGYQHEPRTLLAASTMTRGDGVILADASAGAFTITALPADEARTKIVRVKKTDASVNKVFIKAAGSDTFEGAATLTLAAQYDFVELYSGGGSTWWRF